MITLYSHIQAFWLSQTFSHLSSRSSMSAALTSCCFVRTTHSCVRIKQKAVIVRNDPAVVGLRLRDQKLRLVRKCECVLTSTPLLPSIAFDVVNSVECVCND